MKVLKVGSFSARIHLTTYENEDDKLYPVGQKIELVYDRVSSDHTKIFWHRADGGREKTINTGDNFGVFSNDLTTVLDFKQPKWDMIHLKGGEYLLEEVQDIFLNTPSITKHLEIDANTCPHPDYLERIFGESFLIDDDRDQYKCWFFKRADNRVLQMEFWDYLILFRFKIITMEAVPEDAFISSIIGSLNRVCLITCKDDDDDDELYPNGSKIKLYYEQLSSEQTTITWHRSDGKREKTINKGDNVNVFSEDLLTVLGCKQPKWDKIHVNCEEEIFLNTSSIIKYLEMQANRFPHPDCLERIFGDCYLIDMETDEIRCWFFKRADNYVVQIKFAEDMDSFSINIITLEAVPDDAFISSS
ncbi:hypothetical protein CAEBREN_21615 [Caenorhabditis brenneri]|uniref:DUF38 domain-containing protein n=1 Tax=Caenorhabditis brenneri TaxID=135651 RepID=G0N1I5_CAEBE|nr:hypothetical protein CAEBREN_21615 [Caenorhabditis brenneri]